MKATLIVILAYVLAVVYAADADTPLTLTRFQANYKQTTVQKMGGGMPMGSGFPAGFAFNEMLKRNIEATGDMTTSDSGVLYYDSLGRRMRTNVNTISISVEGTPININMDNVAVSSLLLYDLHKNYSFSTGGSGSCECADLSDPDMPILYLTPSAIEGATIANDITITVNNQAVVTTRYTTEVYFGGLSTDIVFFVAGDNTLRRTTFSASIAGISIDSTFDFWNVQALTVGNNFIPLDTCSCPVANPPVLNVTASFPTSCPSVPSGCVCATTAFPSGLFCSAYVTYNIDANLFIDFTDNFVEEVFNAFSAPSGTPQTCYDEFKTFLCRFYFPQCLEGGASLKPTEPNFSAACGAEGASKVQSNDALSIYQTEDKTKGSDKPGGDQTSSAAAFSASVFVALVSVAALLL